MEIERVEKHGGLHITWKARISILCTVRWSPQRARWLFVVPHPTNPRWNKLSHRHETKDAAIEEALVYLGTLVLES